MTIQQKIGQKGEDFAALYLFQDGYKIKERNWRTGRAEIDIIAEKDGILVFVEVKAKSSKVYGPPELAVDEKKERLLFSAANRYMESIDYEWEIRFDIISILFQKGKETEITHFEDVFY